MKIIFFGSFQHYSAYVLEALIKHPDIEVAGVVTTPPAPIGRQKVLTKNPVQTLAEKHQIPICTPDTLTPEVEATLPVRQAGFTSGVDKPSSLDFFVVAGYGKMFPPSWLNYPKYGSLNLHFSLLPKFRGANPAEWAILLGETETGVSLIEMAEEFDTGAIIAKKAIPISHHDTRETLYERLYQLGAKELPDWLISYGRSVLRPYPQPNTSPTPTAYRFNRAQSYIPWEIITAAMNGQPFDPTDLPPLLNTAFFFLKLDQSSVISEQLSFLERTSRALAGYPALWTYIPTNKGKKRLKIIYFTRASKPESLTPNLVQLEGHSPAKYNQIKNQLITDTNPAL